MEQLPEQDANWGRWGEEDQVGTLNLITPERRVSAARAVSSGRVVSLSREFPVTPGPTNPFPAQHYTFQGEMADVPGTAGYAGDYIGMQYHSATCTHLDALCHVWGERGWNDRDPKEFIASSGATWAGVENFREGIFTRAWMFDVPRFRGAEFVTMADPVTAEELRRIAAAHGLEPRPGDAVVVHAGRAAFERTVGPYGGEVRPGLDASCSTYLQEIDASVLVWDMLDMAPFGREVSWSVHGALFSLGLPLLDNADLTELAAACIDEGRNDFLLVVAPLVVVGGTGSPVNPLAVF